MEGLDTFWTPSKNKTSCSENLQISKVAEALSASFSIVGGCNCGLGDTSRPLVSTVIKRKTEKELELMDKCDSKLFVGFPKNQPCRAHQRCGRCAEKIFGNNG